MSRKPGTGFRPTVEALEDRTALSAVNFRGAATGYFAPNPSPGARVNLPAQITTPLRTSLPVGPGHSTTAIPAITHPSAQTIGTLRAAVIPARPTAHAGSSSSTITTGASNIPGQSSGAGLNPGLTTYNLTQPAANAPQNTTVYSSNPTNSAGSTPWWLY